LVGGKKKARTNICHGAKRPTLAREVGEGEKFLGASRERVAHGLRKEAQPKQVTEL